MLFTKKETISKQQQHTQRDSSQTQTTMCCTGRPAVTHNMTQ